AIAKQSEDENLDEEVAETAFAKLQDGEEEVARKLFAFPASNPESDYYYDSNYYLGTGEYGVGSKLVSVPEGEATPEVIAAKFAEAKPHLESAVKSLDLVAKATKQEVIDKYKVNALYFKGLSELALDNVMYDPENAKGLFIDSFTQLIAAIQSATNLTDDQKAYAGDAHNYIGYYAYLKGDNAKAKQHFAETLKVKPEDPF